MNEYVEGKHTEQEWIDYKKFEEFAACLKQMFSKYRGTEYGCPFDALSLTLTGGTYAVEIKSRNKKYPDYFIEFEKFSKMRELWRNFCWLPVYINFIGDEAYLWRLNEVRKVRTELNVWIDDGNGGYEGDRICLMPSEAYYFKKVNGKWKLQSRPTTEVYPQSALPRYNDNSILDNEITKYNYYKINEREN